MEITPPLPAAPVSDFTRSLADAAEAARLLEEFRCELALSESGGTRSVDGATRRAILAAAPEVQAALVCALVRRIYRELANRDEECSFLSALLEDLLARRLPLTPEDHHFLGNTPFPLAYPKAALRIVEDYAGQHPLSERSRGLLRRLSFGQGADGRRLQARVKVLLAAEASRGLKPGEPWADALIAHLATLPQQTRAAWEWLLAHAFTASGSRPSARWLKVVETRLERVGRDQFREQVLAWLKLSAEPRFRTLHPRNADLLKGLVWCCGLLDTPEMAQALGAAARSSYQPGPDTSLRAASVGNACAVVLGGMSEPAALHQLCQLQLEIKHRPCLQVIEKSLAEAAARAGLTVEDLAELTVPTFGMQSPGLLRETFGEHSVEVELAGGIGVEWRWRNTDGKLQKSLPAAVKAVYSEEFRTLKGRVKEAQKLLPAQRDRLERLLLSERSWSLVEWRERYLEHPLLALFVRRLIWQIQDGGRALLAIPHEGRLTDEADRPVEGLDEQARVRLWHPLGFAPEAVLRWRVWLEEHGVMQPFKQAHREVYLLTDAELNTGTYSNRFAAHILKQHQAAALARQRGWQYEYLGSWDSGGAGAVLALPQWGVQAEFWVDGAAGGLAASGVALYVSTDQVRFVPLPSEAAGTLSLGSQAPLSLTEVPALVFTEVMRNVDLFVGVASVGNDPAWRDAGDLRTHDTYWESYSFGELSVSAQTRREVLERLLPRLKIRERCRLDGKFLRVQGELRAYKIHLGSGNILMEPNDQYLCIVPERSGSGADSLFLPFEGDRMLSLILSKAFLLAEDRKIQDPSITSQIGGGS